MNDSDDSNYPRPPRLSTKKSSYPRPPRPAKKTGLFRPSTQKEKADLAVIMNFIIWPVFLFFAIQLCIHLITKTNSSPSKVRENGEIPGFSSCANNLGTNLGGMSINQATCYCCNEVGGTCGSGKVAKSMKVCRK